MDGQKQWESADVTRGGGLKPFSVDVTGAKVLTLETRVMGFSNHAASAVWGDPVLDK